MLSGYEGGVFPAHAGMNRSMLYIIADTYRVPRTRGDEPILAELKKSGAECSPHTRG